METEIQWFSPDAWKDTHPQLQDWLESSGWSESLAQRGVPVDRMLRALRSALDCALATWHPDKGVPFEAYKKRGFNMAMHRLWDESELPRGRSVDARSLTDRDVSSLADPGVGPAESVGDADELEVLAAWCAGQGKAGDLLLRRLRAETAAELAAEYGMSVSQVRRVLATVADVAQGRFQR